MKLDKLFQSLLLTGAVVFFISTPAKAEEVREDGIGEYSTATVGKSTSDEKVGVTDEEFALSKAGVAIAKSPVLAPSTRKPRLKESQIANLVPKAKANQASKNIPQLSEIKLPATSASMLVQTPSPTNSPNPEPTSGEQVVPITGVKANPTPKGVEVILETPLGTQLQVTNRSTGNNFIADITGGQLRLPSGDAFTFRSEKPLAGITEITVTNVDAKTVRVTVVGEKALPAVELFDDNAGLVFGVTTAATAQQPPQQPQTPQAEEKPASETPQEKPAAQTDEPIELVVTGERDEYRVPNASTATRTDTPLRDIPQSIQVVPRQVIEDRNVRTITEAVETVSGVAQGESFFGVQGLSNSVIRGFSQDFGGESSTLRNGVRDGGYAAVRPIGTIEQVEVLKGPASVLFGALEPGGIINYITRQPLSEPYYNLALEIGNYGFYESTLDLSGPLTADDTLLYRLIASYQSAGTYQDFVEIDQVAIAPSITLNLGDRTRLNLYYEYAHYDGSPAFLADAPLRSDGSFLPRDFYPGYPDLNTARFTTHRFGYTLNHEFSDNWQIRNNLAATLTDSEEVRAVSDAPLEDDRIIANLFSNDATSRLRNYFGQIDVLGKFDIGSVANQLLIGFDFNRFTWNFESFGVRDQNLPPLDSLDPNYDIPQPEYVPEFRFDPIIESYGLYVQNQITFTDQLKLLIGGRYDWITNDTETADFGVFGNTTDEPVQSDGAFSPRIGLVYQPSDTVSLYASYSRSFRQSIGVNPDRRVFEPTRGTQYEIGIKTDWLDNRLSATLAAYHLTRTNVTTPDPDNPTFSIQTGEQRSQGIELDVQGEILPGWNIIASYAYTDAVITEDNTFPEGNRLANAPRNQASFWTTYFIQDGALEGLGFGLGLFYVGERQVDLANSFELDDYLRTDAAIYYRRGRFRSAINIRNLFDIDYASYGSRRDLAQRGDPFTITGSVSWEF